MLSPSLSNQKIKIKIDKIWSALRYKSTNSRRQLEKSIKMFAQSRHMKLLLSIIAICAQLGQLASLELAKKQARINLGDNVPLAQYPFMINIWHGDDFQCGGTLITPNCVLTAAHCLYAVDDATKLKVFAPEEHKLRTHERNVKSWRVPKEYNMKTADQDIAVLVLESSLNATTVQIDYEPVQAHETLTITGWGNTDNLIGPTYYLRAIHAPVSKQSVCDANKDITENMFCVEEVDGVRPCSHDSGGPALRPDGKQVGIISKGERCDYTVKKDSQGMYTRLSSKRVRRFLEESIKKYCM